MSGVFQSLVGAESVIIADGGMGTMLMALGLARGTAPELWNIEQPDMVRRIHAGYINAGAQIILTNTFGGNRLRLGAHGLDGRVSEFNQAAARLARLEVEQVERRVVVGGSIGPTGQMMVPLGELDFDEAVTIFVEQAEALVIGGVDVLWIETMSDLEEVRAAVAGCRQVAPHVPLVTTMTFDTRGRTMMGVTPEQALETLRSLDVDGLGANCGNGPDEVEIVIEKMHAVDPTALLVAKANAGIPRMVNDRPAWDATPEMMGAYALSVRHKGARIIGACCGSTPEHIRAIATALKMEEA